MLTFGPKQIANDGLLLHFDAANVRCYPGSGTLLTDLSGNGNDGTMSNGASVIDNSINFPGTASNKVSTSFNDALGDFTVEVWFKASTTIRAWERLVDRDYVDGFFLARNSSTANSWGGGVIEAAAPYGIFITLTDGYWHHLVSVRRSTIHELWGNGVVGASNTVSSALLDSTAVTLGHRTSLSTQYLDDGDIAIVRIYDRALTDPEIVGNYYAQKDRFQ